MGLKLTGHPKSTCTARVLFCLHEVGADFELLSIDFLTAEHKHPSYLAKNPFGLVPVLEDGNLTLFESRAIARYVATKYKGGENDADLLRLDNPEEKAMVEAWMEVESHHFNAPAYAMGRELVKKPRLYDQPPDERLVGANARLLAQVLDVYEGRLSKSKYLAGDFYSMADLTHLPAIFHLMKTSWAFLINSRPHVKAWWEDISSRPASKKVGERMTSRQENIRWKGFDIGVLSRLLCHGAASTAQGAATEIEIGATRRQAASNKLQATRAFGCVIEK